jgi:hypothetical protein
VNRQEVQRRRVETQVFCFGSLQQPAKVFVTPEHHFAEPDYPSGSVSHASSPTQGSGAKGWNVTVDAATGDVTFEPVNTA